VQYIILVIFMISPMGCGGLQVMQNDVYAQLAEKNRIRNVPILAPRGKFSIGRPHDRRELPVVSALLLRDSTRDLKRRC